MTLRRAISGATAAVLVLLSAVTTGGVAAADDPDPTVGPGNASEYTTESGWIEPNKVADPATYHEYPGVRNPEYFTTTTHPGRIWTDKSVFDKDVGIPATMAQDPGELKLGPDELAVGLSALGSTRHISGEHQVASDVVFILDNSASMLSCVESTATCSQATNYENSRAWAMVKAVNTATGIIASANPDSRVAMVWFGDTAEIFLEFGRVSDLPYLSLRQVGEGLQASLHIDVMVEGVSKSIRVGYVGTGTSNPQSTNIHRGVYEGMEILASQQDATADGPRMPSAILFSDGEPTYSSSSQSWWTPNNQVQGPEVPGGDANQAYGNGFLAALTAAHMKERINDAYNRDRSGYDARVFTVGLGVTRLSGTDVPAYAEATLNPQGALGGGNPIAERFNSDFGTYLSLVEGSSFDVSVGGQQSKYGVSKSPMFSPTSLAYNDDYFAPATREDLESVFAKIASWIVQEAQNYPVELEVGSANADGYVTFTDELGPYMRVTDMNRLAFCSVAKDATDPSKCNDQTFMLAPLVGPVGGVTSFGVAGDKKYEANALYGEAEVNDIKITVKSSTDLAKGDIVTVRIPAALLPIFNKDITVDVLGNPTSIEGFPSHPVHAYYKVAPKQDVLNYLNGGDVDLGTDQGALESYMETHGKNGRVRFYSNKYDETGAYASATFVPANANDFYRFSIPAQLFGGYDKETEEFTDPLSFNGWRDLEPDTPVFYGDTVYVEKGILEPEGPEEDPEEGPDVLGGAGNEKFVVVVPTTIRDLLAAEDASLDGTAVVAGAGDSAWATSGLRDFGVRPKNLDHVKCDSISWVNGQPVLADTCSVDDDGDVPRNLTGTAPYVRSTANGIAGGDPEGVTVALGNNGYLEYALGPLWTLSKSAETRSGTESVQPGDTVIYTLTVENTSAVDPVTGVVVTDDLSGVLAEGVVTLSPLDDPVRGTVGVDDSGMLTWDVGTVTAGEKLTYTYSVTVVESGTAYGITLHNVAWGTGQGITEDGEPAEELLPEQCTEEEPCETEHEVGSPEWTIEKSSDTQIAVPGGEITYELTVTNTGDVPLYNAQIVDELQGHDVDVTDIWTFLDEDGWDGTYTVRVGEGGQVVHTDTVPSDGLQHTITELGVGEHAVVTFTVHLPDQFGNVHLRNTVIGEMSVDGSDEEFPPAECAEPNDDVVCRADHVYQSPTEWTLSKSAETSSGTESVQPGDTVIYTLTVENTGLENPVTGVVVTDDLSGVLAEGVVTLSPLDDPVRGTVGVDDSGMLTWDVGTVTAGEKLTYTYSVTVVESGTAYGITLNNVAWGTGQGITEDGEEGNVPPEQCTEEEPCETEHEVGSPEWTIEKSSDTQIAVPGGEITYELTVTNDGNVALLAATISDGPVSRGDGITDIWTFLDEDGWDGDYTVRVGADTQEYTDADPSNGLQHTITKLGVGEHAVVTFTVNLPDQFDGVHLRNTVTGSLIPDPAGPGEQDGTPFPPADCAIPNGEAPCSVDHTYPPRTEWTLDKTAETPSGTSSVQPGDTVTYTLTVKNTDAKNAVTMLVVTDDLAEVLADGVVTLDALAVPDVGTVRQEGTTLIWDVGTLAADKTVTYTYSVTVIESATAYGTTLHNEAWGTGRGVTEDGPDEVLPPGQCTEDEPCSTDHEVPVPAWTLAKSSDTDTAVPGGDITYELTVTNTGDVPLYGAQVIDGPRKQADGVTDIWSALADGGWKGEYTVRIGEGDPVVRTDADPADGLQAELATVPVGSTATVTFTVTLPSDLDTVHLRNTVTGALPGDPDGPVYPPAGCSEPGPEDACSADHEYVAPTPDPSPDPTQPPANSGGAKVTSSTGGALVATGTRLAALVAAAGLMTVAGLLLAHRRREESTK